MILEFSQHDGGDDPYEIQTDGEYAIARPKSGAGGATSLCGQCEGRGFVIAQEDGYDVSVECTCTFEQHRIRCYNAATIPADYADKHLSDYRENRGGSQGKVKACLMDYLSRPKPLAEKGFLLVGRSGVGKTHLLCAVLRELSLERGIACKYIDFFHLTERIRGCFGSDSGVTTEQILEPLVEVPLLAIDELGKGMQTDFETHVIDQLVTRRYNANRSLIATTNYVPAKLAERLEDGRAALESANRFAKKGKRREYTSYTLEERTDERIVSRLYEMCDVLHVKGEDYRYDKLS